MTEISERVSQLEAQVNKINNTVFRREREQVFKNKIHDTQKEEMNKVADQIKAIDNDSSIDAKEKKRQIQDLEESTKAKMAELIKEFEKEFRN